MTSPPSLDAALRDRFTVADDEGRSKVTTLAAAIRAHVRPHDVVLSAYSDARPNAALLELARAFANTSPHLTLVTSGLVNVQHCLIELGIVDRLVASFAGENYPVARPNPVLVRTLREGRVTIENWSLWTLVARLAAGALGVSHFPVRSLAGSSIGEEAAARGEYLELTLPGQSEPTGFVTALRPDIVLLQATAADQHGNVVLAAPYGEGNWGSLAARRGVIACVEQILPTSKIRQLNTLTRIPAHAVVAVCEVPYGAHPYGMNSPALADGPSYVEDLAFVAETFAACQDEAAFLAWIDEWVLGVADDREYRQRLGTDRLAALHANRDPDAWLAEYQESWTPDEPASRLEMQVVATSRQLGERVRAVGYDAVLSGVGLANLAAWLGVGQLRRAGVDVELMAEIGLYGFDPRPGEPFIFSGRNVPTNKMLADVMTVLGALVSGPGARTIGVVGAGQIDAQGAINSTRAASGDFIVGSGGANDVLTGAEESIITVSHSPSRLVDVVPYVTAPGQRVSSIVTDLAVLERAPEGSFVLTRYLPAAGANPRAAVELIRSRTGWDLAVAPKVTAVPNATPDELLALRVFDPGRLFLRDRA